MALELPLLLSSDSSKDAGEDSEEELCFDFEELLEEELGLVKRISAVEEELRVTCEWTREVSKLPLCNKRKD